MSKYYRVLKETPIWEEGCILSNDSGHYKPISDLWVKDIKGVDEAWWEGAAAVENQPTWFQRVYEVSVLGKAKYLTKDAAKDAYAKLHKEA